MPTWGQQNTKVQIEGSVQRCEFDPIPNLDTTTIAFIQAMKKGGWALGFPFRGDDQPISYVRRSDLTLNPPGGNLFTNVTIGIFMGHGGFGTSPDGAPGASGSMQTYFGSGYSGDAVSPWLRLCQLGMGGNLKWMTILACNSLCDPNYGSMTQVRAIPLKETHLLLGTASFSYMEDNIGEYYARNMLSKNQPIRLAWFNAADRAYHEPHTSAITNTVIFRVSGYPECIDDTIKSNTAPFTPSATPNNLTKRDFTVFQYP